MNAVTVAAAATLTLILSACAPAATNKSTKPLVVSSAAAKNQAIKLNVTPSSLAKTDGAKVVAKASYYLNYKYRWGGKSPKTGFDCSGLVSHVYQEAVGLSVPGPARLQAKQGKSVARNNLQAGDLVFFNTRGYPKSHVGIYIGDGKFIHALNRKAGVRVDAMNNSYYAKRYEGARRVIK